VISTAAAIQRNRDPPAAARPAPRALWLLVPAVVVICVSSRSWQQTLYTARHLERYLGRADYEGSAVRSRS